jgi:hypothetical protein
MSEHECPDCGSKCDEVKALRAELRRVTNQAWKEKNRADLAEAERDEHKWQADASAREYALILAEVERMRPVVEAAKWVDLYLSGENDGHFPDASRDLWKILGSHCASTFTLTMNAYRAASSEQEASAVHPCIKASSGCIRGGACPDGRCLHDEQEASRLDLADAERIFTDEQEGSNA